MDLLYEALSSIHPLSEEFKKAIAKNTTRLSLPKNHILLHAASISDHAYFLETGFAVSYSFVKGKKQVERFWNAGQIIISPSSFFERLASMEYIQLVEPGDVLLMSYDRVMSLLETFPEANTINRAIMSQYYAHFKERRQDLLNLNGIERYDKLLRTFPHIEQLVSQEYIASYIGITPQSLSRQKRSPRKT